MKLKLVKHLLFGFLSLLFIPELYANGTDGIYQTLNPERGRNGQPTQKILVQMTVLNGQPVLVTAGCNPGCTPIIYSLQEEPSATLGRDVYFSKAGIYLFRVTDNSFVSAIPTAMLGKQAWDKLMFVNVYAKEGTALTLDANAASEFALEQSRLIMNTGTQTVMTRGAGEYHFAAPVKVIGKSYEKGVIEFDDKQSITVTTCEKCPSDTYEYLSDESAITGTPTYINRLGNLLFDVKDGVLVWADFKRGYGKKLWGKYNQFNLYAKDLGYVRSIRSKVEKQNAIDQMLVGHAENVKTEMDKRRQQAEEREVASQTLPAKGLRDSQLESDITQASQRWADSYGWKESIEYSYLTSNDWRINHHVLTGLVTGRFINGVIVMKREDGLCSFHYAVFGQDYDGNSFVGTHMVGLTPGQIKLACSKI